MVLRCRSKRAAGGALGCILCYAAYWIVQTRPLEPQWTLAPLDAADISLPPELMALGEKILGVQGLQDALASTQSFTGVLHNVPVQIYFSSWESPETVDLRHSELSVDEYGVASVVPGSLIVDVGGNIGDTALMACLRPGFSDSGIQVLSLEPVPLQYFYLRWNLWKNGVKILELDSWGSSPGSNRPAGVVALNAGLSSDGKPFEM